MPRSRDLILFMLLAVALFAAILLTLAHSTALLPAIGFDTATSSSEIVLTAPREGIDRQGTIAHLREKIADMLTISDAQPSVVTEPAPVATTSLSEAPSTEKKVTLMKCPGATDGLAVAAKWPREGVSVQEAEGMRVVSVFDTAGQPSTLLQIPLYPGAAGSPTCLDNELIGVTTSGSLIFNTDAISYDSTSAGTLIGYARDGVPIYGQYKGETDACGGYQAGGGYRYSISSERNFILGCFGASPHSFTL